MRIAGQRYVKEEIKLRSASASEDFSYKVAALQALRESPHVIHLACFSVTGLTIDDSCASIEAAFGISHQDFLKWNVSR